MKLPVIEATLSNIYNGKSSLKPLFIDVPGRWASGREKTWVDASQYFAKETQEVIISLESVGEW